jgi:hypothetical protein
MSRFAALYERSLSVIIRLDLRLCFFSSLTNSHLAAFVSRRVYSNLYTPHQIEG